MYTNGCRIGLVALLCAVATVAAARLAVAAGPLVQVGRGPAPVIDGQLTDTPWESCAQLFPFIQMDGVKLAESRTRAFIYYDEAALYVGFRCDEPNVGALMAACTTRDDALWRDDCVEFMLEAPGQQGFTQVIVNTLGVTFDQKDDEKSWNPAIQAAAFTGEDYWSAEFALPWADVGGPPEPGATWAANCCRERKVGGGELSSWSCSHGRFTNPDTFGELLFAEDAVRLDRFELSPPLPGANSAQVELRLPGGAAGELRVTGADALSVPAGGPHTLDVLFPVGLSDEDVLFEALVGDRVVWRSAVPVTVTPRPQLGNLEQNVALLVTLHGTLPDSSPLRGSVMDVLAPAKEAAQALRAAIENSLARQEPLDPSEYRKLNGIVAGQAATLSLTRWPLWTKNNWLDLERTELPEHLDSLNRLQVTALVNEYESRNFVITNLATEPLRVRVTASDLEWFPEPDGPVENLVVNGGFDEDANGDGIPDGWRHVSGDRGRWRLEQDPDRGPVLTIDCAGPGDHLTVRQDLELEGGREYTLEFWAKSDRATPTVKVGFINSGWTWSAFSAQVAGTNDWHRVRRTVRVPESPHYQVVIFAPSGGTGTVWLDAVSVVKGAKPSVEFAATAPRLAVADWQELRGGSVVADPLIPLNNAGRLDVAPGESRQVWLTLAARDLAPGQYECSIRVQPLATVALEGAPPGKSIHVALDVQPLRVPTHADFAVYNWDYAYAEPYVRDLYEHKVNFFLVPSRMPVPDFDAEGNPLGEMDFAALDQKIRLKLRYARQAGGELLFSYGIIRDFYQLVERKYGWEYLDETWVKAFRWAYGQWIEHLKGLGLRYDEFCVQLWDEATGPQGKEAIQGGKLLRELDPNLRLVMDGVQTAEEVKAMDPYIDVWIPHLSALEKSTSGPALVELYKSLGEPVYCYTCSTFMKALSPYIYHRLKPWQAARLGLDGVCYWDYNSWRGDPWNDFDGPIADCGAIYNGAEGPVTSRRWEASREGIEDWQIMRLLEGLAAGNGMSTAEARTLIDEALDTVLTHKDQPDLAHQCRLRLLQAAVSLAQARPLEVLDVTEVIQDRNLVVAFATNWSARGKLLYRIIGEKEWQTVEFPHGTRHKVTVTLPVFAQAEWVVLAWDAYGRVAAARGPQK